MQVLRSLAKWRALQSKLSPSLGLVPTMGALHQGHLSLIRRSAEENAHTLVWVFVNPLQFERADDLLNYPHQLEQDIALAQQHGANILLAPPAEEVHPSQAQTLVQVEPLSQVLEGKYRPGHFMGVATVVAKLLCLTLPKRVYFGQKDAQQCVVIRRLVEDLFLPCQVVICHTVRDTDGLALSSRNALLSPTVRQQAAVLYQTLQTGVRIIATGEQNASIIRERMLATLQQAPLARLEYLSLAHPETLEEQNRVTGTTLISLAAYFEKVRLIDNLLAQPPVAKHTNNH